MKESLAERLLARVMDWQAEDVARERPTLQAMAAYKYDEYQQFSPGLRFVESLALWLNDLKDPAHKKEAYRFVKDRLIFFSTAEMHHLVSIAYPDFIRPRLLQRVATENGLNPYHLGRIADSQAFRIHERSCLFLGLSDGARTDVFRRTNEDTIDHEQVLQTYEIKKQRVGKLLNKLRSKLAKSIAPGMPAIEKAQFRTMVLLDDFSASGTSYLREENGHYDGKLNELALDIVNPQSDTAQLMDCSRAHVLVVLYIATEQALKHIEAALSKVWQGYNVTFDVLAVHPLAESIRIKRGDPLDALLDEYYDKDRMEDSHTEKGGQGVKYGYAGCGLPVVLAHNSPNNSIFPIWNSKGRLRALFPRVSRHKQP
ncbi:phosphoribosyltransferase-like protein [Opitutus terrae]|uniref:PRTase-CE domain-containing protein n=1 Tax=Opitutus terrae (strain DSM 11246 / JCM 15787 / PB90-1) TaxID=452637 RepID=B1ZSI3_OPITP|nr:hypothetical protein [Opitutus terrae]ACB73840.1 conserved hypothetical protein [Opitutus terrae PB90-1]